MYFTFHESSNLDETVQYSTSADEADVDSGLAITPPIVPTSSDNGSEATVVVEPQQFGVTDQVSVRVSP